MLSRGGSETRELWYRYINKLKESDEQERRLERQARAGDPEAARKLSHARARAGDVVQHMKHLVDAYARSKKEFDSTDRSHPEFNDIVRKHMADKQAVIKHSKETGIHHADHAHRDKDEHPRDFAERIGALEGHTWRGAINDSHHGTISWSVSNPEDTHDHESADRIEAAWRREVPNGYVERGHRTRYDQAEPGPQHQRRVGSYLHFRTSDRRAD